MIPASQPVSKNIVHVSWGDWEGIYVDDKLITEGHSLDARQTLEAIGVEFEHLDRDEVAEINGMANLPENLTDLP